MTKKIFHSICLVALIVFFSSVILIMGALYSYFSDIQKKQLSMQTDLIAKIAANEGIRYLDEFVPDPYRITWIRPDGTVLYDSSSDTGHMENHLKRTEIRQALENGYGESDRYSATLMERSFYCARRLEDGSVLRLSATHGTIFILLLGMSQPVFLVFAIAIVLSVVLAARLSNHIVKPFNTLDLEHPLHTSFYEELSPLLLRISSQQNQLKLKEDQLQQKQEELYAVISNMKEGMILLTADGSILSINQTAASLADALRPDAVQADDGQPLSGHNKLRSVKNCIGKHLSSISSCQILLDAADNALRGIPQEQTAAFGQERYQITASPVCSETSVSGAALLLFNVTEKEKAEQMRREFTANVSHELKTPLHSICGYAELLKNDMVKKDDICPFAEKIYTEACRMTKLVEDIMNLSHLDEGADDMQFEQQDLSAIAAAAAGSLAQEAAAAGVSVTISSEPAVVDGISQLLFGIVYNLCDNAVKYNHAGGDVWITIRSGADTVDLTVRDTGIGISKEHQTHIFERFYRVDKGRSRQMGGTGLGLSIVKHAAKIHHAQITLQSDTDQGTIITISFPKHQVSFP